MNCCVLLLMTFFNMAIIHLLWWDRRQHYGHIWDLEYGCYKNMDKDFVDDFDVRTMVDLIGMSLSDGLLRY